MASSSMQTQDSQVVTIAVMGATGAGKSTFINLVSGSHFRVGYGLESCTSEVQVAPPFLLDGKTVTLVDTPGFDDTVKTEAEILRLIADFLSATYKQGRKLNGVIFLHRISDHRMGGVARKNFRLFRKVCGDDTLKNVVVVTNMWCDVSAEVGEARERELAANELFFKAALDKGAHMVRHDNTVLSAQTIVRGILGNQPAPLLLQREVVDERKPLAQTGAGLDLQAELDRQASAHREELAGLKSEMAELLAEKDARHKEELDELADALKGVQGQLERVEGESARFQRERDGDRAAHENQVLELVAAMHEKEAEFQRLQADVAEHKARIAQVEAELLDAKRKAEEQAAVRQRAEEDLKASNTVYQDELVRMRQEFERKLELAKADAELAKPRAPPPTQQTLASQQWSKVYAAQRERRGIFAAWGSVIDHFIGSSTTR